MMKLALAAAMTVAATAAAAGNINPAPAPAPVIAPPPPPAPLGVDWTGPYVGAQLGYGFGDAEGADFDGVFGGLLAGYNYDFGSVVLGAEIDYNLADFSIDGGGTIDQVGRLKVKAGYEVGRALPYVTAGAAYANADLPGGNEDDFGFVVGAGLDYLFTNNVFGGVEYNYHRFDSFGNVGDVDANTFAVKVGYKF